MNPNTLIIQGPFELEAKVLLISANDENHAVVSIGCGYGKIPTPEDIQAILKNASSFQEGWRLADKRTYWNYMCQKVLGGEFAMPGQSEFDPMLSATTPNKLQAISDAIHKLMEVRDGSDFECECHDAALKLFFQYRTDLADDWNFESDYKTELDAMEKGDEVSDEE